MSSFNNHAMRALFACSLFAVVIVLCAGPADSAQGQGNNGIAQRVAVLEAQVAGMQSQFGSQISDLNVALAAETARAEAAENALADRATAFEHNITVLRTIVDAHETRLTALSGRAGSLEVRATALEHNITVLRTIVDAHETQIGGLEERTQFISIEGTNMLLTGANLCIVNGTGSSAITNGLGNLVIGYNEDLLGGPNGRGGSHNVVVGTEHSYSSYSGIVAGTFNSVAAPFASVLGGQHNTIFGPNAVICGGGFSLAAGSDSVICGGYGNGSIGDFSVVGGGLNVQIFGDRQWGAGNSGTSFVGNFRTP